MWKIFWCKLCNYHLIFQSAFSVTLARCAACLTFYFRNIVRRTYIPQQPRTILNFPIKYSNVAEASQCAGDKEFCGVKDEALKVVQTIKPQFQEEEKTLLLGGYKQNEHKG